MYPLNSEQTTKRKMLFSKYEIEVLFLTSFPLLLLMAIEEKIIDGNRLGISLFTENSIELIISSLNLLEYISEYAKVKNITKYRKNLPNLFVIIIATLS